MDQLVLSATYCIIQIPCLKAIHKFSSMGIRAKTTNTRSQWSVVFREVSWNHITFVWGGGQWNSPALLKYVEHKVWKINFSKNIITYMFLVMLWWCCFHVVLAGECVRPQRNPYFIRLISSTFIHSETKYIEYDCTIRTRNNLLPIYMSFLFFLAFSLFNVLHFISKFVKCWNENELHFHS